MPKKGPVVAALVLFAIVAFVVGGALLASGEETEGDGGDGPRIPFATAISAFLAFVAGFALRDMIAKRAQRAARRPASGGKAA